MADSALYGAENLQKLADTSLQWIPRVPATLTEVQEVPGPGAASSHASVAGGVSRAQHMLSTYGGVAQRWVLIYSEQRQPQAQRTVDEWRKQE